MLLQFEIIEPFDVDGDRQWEIERYDGPIPEQGDHLNFEGEPSYQVDSREMALSQKRQQCDWVTLHLRPA
jgi:hypothetical protein